MRVAVHFAPNIPCKYLGHTFQVTLPTRECPETVEGMKTDVRASWEGRSSVRSPQRGLDPQRYRGPWTGRSGLGRFDAIQAHQQQRLPVVPYEARVGKLESV